MNHIQIEKLNLAYSHIFISCFLLGTSTFSTYYVIKPESISGTEENKKHIGAITFSSCSIGLAAVIIFLLLPAFQKEFGAKYDDIAQARNSSGAYNNDFEDYADESPLVDQSNDQTSGSVSQPNSPGGREIDRECGLGGSGGGYGTIDLDYSYSQIYGGSGSGPSRARSRPIPWESFGNRKDKTSLLIWGAICGTFLGMGTILTNSSITMMDVSSHNLFVGLFVALIPLLDYAICDTHLSTGKILVVSAVLFGLFLEDGCIQDNCFAKFLGLGTGVAFLGTLNWCMLYISIDRAVRHVDCIEAVMYSLAAAFLASFLFSLFMDYDSWMDPIGIILPSSIFIIANAVLISLGYALCGLGQRYVSLFQTSLILSLQPVVFALWSFLLIERSFSILDLIGTAVIVCTVVYSIQYYSYDNSNIDKIYDESLERTVSALRNEPKGISSSENNPAGNSIGPSERRKSGSFQSPLTSSIPGNSIYANKSFIAVYGRNKTPEIANSATSASSLPSSASVLRTKSRENLASALDNIDENGDDDDGAYFTAEQNPFRNAASPTHARPTTSPLSGTSLSEYL